MCRVMLANKQGVMEFHKWLMANPSANTESSNSRGYYTIPAKTAAVVEQPADGLLGWLEKMEDSMGGNGNGLALLKGNEVIAMVKGTKLTVETTVQMLLTYDYDWAVWHTRLTSSGTTNDANCHPFHYQGHKHDLVWCMNGTEGEYTKIGKYLDNITDTEVIGRIAVELQLPVPEFFDNFHSVFVGTMDGKPFAVRNSGALVRFKTSNDKAVLFCSQLPSDVEISLPIGYVWNNGEEIAVPRATNYMSMNQWYPLDDEDDFGTHTVRRGVWTGGKWRYDTPATTKKSSTESKVQGYIEQQRAFVRELMPKTVSGTPWYSVWNGSYTGMMVGRVPNIVELSAIVDKVDKAEHYDKLPAAVKGLCTQLVCELSARASQKHDSFGSVLHRTPDVVRTLAKGVPSLDGVQKGIKTLLTTAAQDPDVAPFTSAYLPLIDRLMRMHEEKPVLKFQVSNLLAYVLLSIADILEYVPDLLEANPALREDTTDPDDNEPKENEGICPPAVDENKDMKEIIQ